MPSRLARCRGNHPIATSHFLGKPLSLSDMLIRLTRKRCAIKTIGKWYILIWRDKCSDVSVYRVFSARNDPMQGRKTLRFLGIGPSRELQSNNKERPPHRFHVAVQLAP